MRELIDFLFDLFGVVSLSAIILLVIAFVIVMIIHAYRLMKPLI